MTILLSSCASTGNFFSCSYEPNFFISRRRDVEEKRKLYFMEFKPGEVFKNKKELYYTTGGGGGVYSYQYGTLIQVIPKGSKFVMKKVTVSFSASGDQIIPYFDIECIHDHDVRVYVFREYNSKPYDAGGREFDRLYPYYKVPQGYRGGYFYNREYFEKSR